MSGNGAPHSRRLSNGQLRIDANKGFAAVSALTPVVPPFPRWNGIRTAPQSVAMPFRLGLSVFVIDALLGRLFRGVLPVPPGHPGLDLFQADIPAANKNDTHLAPVAVGGVVPKNRAVG